MSASRIRATSGREQSPQGRPLFAHLVGADEQSSWECNTQLVGGLEIDQELHFRDLLDRQVGRTGASENFPDIDAVIIELRETEINALIRNGLLQPENRHDYGSVQSALYAFLDRALGELGDA
jgi:hypothetical protein